MATLVATALDMGRGRLRRTMSAPRPAHHAEVRPTPWAGARVVTLSSARSFGRHWHEGWGLGLVEVGAQRSYSGRGEVEAVAGDVIATNPGETHDGRPLDGHPRRWRMLLLEAVPGLPWSGADEGLPDLQRAPLLLPVQRRPALAAQLRTLHARLADRAAMTATSATSAMSARAATTGAGAPARPGPHDPTSGLRWPTGDLTPHLPTPHLPPDLTHLACDEALAAVLHGFAAAGPADARPEHAPATPASRADPLLQRVRERLALCDGPPPGLAELATDAGLDRYRLLRRFQAAWGLPPHAWALQHRLALAHARVLRGEAVAEVAAALGFTDQSHLHRHFVRSYGYTPGALRRCAAMPYKTARRAAA
ncbi:MAG: hypothetical protein RL223_4411 [Pseudomonadota bacterium]